MAEVNKKEVEQCKGETAIYIGGLDKNVLLKKEAYTEYIKSLVSAGTCVGQMAACSC